MSNNAIYYNELLIWKKKSFCLASCFLLPAPCFLLLRLAALTPLAGRAGSVECSHFGPFPCNLTSDVSPPLTRSKDGQGRILFLFFFTSSCELTQSFSTPTGVFILAIGYSKYAAFRSVARRIFFIDGSGGAGVCLLRSSEGL